MKKLLLLLLILSSGCSRIVTTVYAQSLPVTKTFSWNANPASDQVTAYNPRLDGTALGPVTTTSVPVTFTTAGAHVLTVSATNLWGTSTVATLNVNVVIPTSPSGLGIQ